MEGMESGRVRRSPPLRWLGTAVLLGATGSAQATWEIDPSVTLTSAYRSNVRMQVDGDPAEEAGVVSMANVRARISNVSERNRISAIIAGGMTQYSGVDSFSDDSQGNFIGILSAGRSLERGGLEFDGYYRRQDMLQGLALVPDAEVGADGEPPPAAGIEDEVLLGENPTDGSSTRPTQRTDFRLAPRGTWQLSPRNAVTVGYVFTSQAFENDDGSEGLRDVESQGVMTQLRHDVTERDSAWLQVSRGWYDPQNGYDSDSWGVTANWRRLMSETLTVTAGAGAQRTENDLDDMTGSLFSLEVEKKLATGAFSATIERSVMPNAYGDVRQTDRMSVSYARGLTDHLSSSLRISAYSLDRGLDGQSNRNQDTIQIRPGLAWRFAEAWTLQMNYGYRWVDREGQDGTASGHEVALGIRYTPPRKR